jgi:hypothetical protein
VNSTIYIRTVRQLCEYHNFYFSILWPSFAAVYMYLQYVYEHQQQQEGGKSEKRIGKCTIVYSHTFLFLSYFKEKEHVILRQLSMKYVIGGQTISCYKFLTACHHYQGTRLATSSGRNITVTIQCWILKMLLYNVVWKNKSFSSDILIRKTKHFTTEPVKFAQVQNMDYVLCMQHFCDMVWNAVRSVTLLILIYDYFGLFNDAVSSSD